MSHKYPYTNAHEANQDWIIEHVKGLEHGIKSVEDAEIVATRSAEIASSAATRAEIAAGRAERAIERHIMLIGDSYIRGFSTIGVNYDSFGQLIKRNIGMPCEVIGGSGAGFTVVGDEGVSFTTALDTYAGDKNAITDIYVFGGFNDRTHSEGEIIAAIDSFIIKARADYPNARLYCGMIGRCTYYQDLELLYKVANAYRKCTLSGMNYIANCEFILRSIDMFAFPDTIHPNQYGHNTLADHLMNAIKGGNIEVTDFIRYRPTTINGIQMPDVDFKQINGTTFIHIAGGEFNLSAYAGNAEPTWLALSGVCNESIPLVGNVRMIAHVDAMITLDDNKDYYVPCDIKLANRQFFIRPKRVSASGSGWYSGRFNHVSMQGVYIAIDNMLN